MRMLISSLAAASALMVSSATAGDIKTWYVYCEGTRQGQHWAVFSENFWSHPLVEDYGREVGRVAKDLFESSHDVELEGCAGVNFTEPSLAEHSRNRTAKLHKRMGDSVYYFPLPSQAMTVPASARPVPARVEVNPVRGPDDAAGSAARNDQFELIVTPIGPDR